jgi:transposase
MDHVQVLAEFEGELPPLLVRRGTLHVIDGMHRLRAARQRGDETIQVRLLDGDENDAFIAAVQANIAHGLPLTLADREAAASRIVTECPHRSDRSVAAITGLSARTVGVIRQRLRPEGDGITARTGRDGRVRPLNSTDGRRVARDVIASRPEASLREIAKIAGISVGTAHDVRERMRRGEDPVVRGQINKGVSRGKSDAERPGGYEPDRPVVDRTATLRRLSKDPALRFTESGRTLLRMLFARATGPDGWQELCENIPPHASYLVVEVARACAQEWLAFASQLEMRLDLAPPTSRPTQSA